MAATANISVPLVLTLALPEAPKSSDAKRDTTAAATANAAPIPIRTPPDGAVRTRRILTPPPGAPYIIVPRPITCSRAVKQ